MTLQISQVTDRQTEGHSYHSRPLICECGLNCQNFIVNLLEQVVV